MREDLWRGVLIGALLFFGAIGAQAQPDRKFSGQVGVHLTGDSLGRGWLAAGARYRLLGSERTALATDISLDFGSRTEPAGRGTFTDYSYDSAFIGIGPQLKMQIPAGRSLPGLYVAASGGLYRLEVAESVSFFNGDDWVTSRGNVRTAGRLGFALKAGIAIRSGFFLEAAVHRIGSFQGQDFDGVSIALGGRF